MTTDQHLDDDAKALAELGYTQELRRGMSAFSNFADLVLDHLDPGRLHHLATRSRWSPAGRPRSPWAG